MRDLNDLAYTQQLDPHLMLSVCILLSPLPPPPQSPQDPSKVYMHSGLKAEGNVTGWGLGKVNPSCSIWSIIPMAVRCFLTVLNLAD